MNTSTTVGASKVAQADLTDGFIVAPEAAETAGCISYWRLSGAVDLDRLRNAWVDQGLDTALLPAPPAPETALRRAVQAQQHLRQLVRPIAKRGAWVIKEEIVVESVNGRKDTEYTTIARVWWENGIRIEPVDASGAYDALERNIRNEYRAQQGQIDPADVSGWLVSLAEQNNAASLRDTGGVYFVPRPAVNFWQKAVAALKFATNNDHKVFQIPALRNSEAIDAIVDAITLEAGRAASAIEADLLLEGDAALGKRALSTRTQTCADVLDKVASYEKLLGIRLDDVRDRVERLRANIATVALLEDN